MGSRFHPRLVAWFDEGLRSGLFKVPNGRHIVLNEFPRLMKESRLRASAGVDPESLREFLVAINPNVVTVPDGSPRGMRQQLAIERDQLPALRKVSVPVLPTHQHEYWFVYTPPLAVMRQGWFDIKSKLSLPAK
jgi:hypothetical protein